MTAPIEIVRSPERKKLSGPVLMIGGSGTVGTGLSRGLGESLGEDQVIIGSSQTEPEKSQNITINVLDLDSLERAIDKIKPGLIIHLAAATNVNRCEQDPAWAKRLNVEGTQNVLKAAGEIPVIYFSTDFVHSGKTNQLKNETDHPDPISEYGQTKRQGELEFERSGNTGGIIRISYPWYSVSDHLRHPKLVDSLWWMRNTLLKGNDVPAFTNVSGSWTSMDHLTNDFWKMILSMREKNIKILHLAGKSSATPYEVGLAVFERLITLGNQREKLGKILPIQYNAEQGKTAPRPQFGGLDSTLARSLGWSQSGILEMIEDGNWE